MYFHIQTCSNYILGHIILKMIFCPHHLHVVVRKHILEEVLGVANDKCETLRDGKTIVFLCKPETLFIFKLRDRAFRVFIGMRAQNILVQKFAPETFRSVYIQWATKNVTSKHIRTTRFIL